MTNREEQLKEVYVVQLNDLMKVLLAMKNSVTEEKTVGECEYVAGYIDAVEELLEHYGEALDGLVEQSKQSIQH